MPSTSFLCHWLGANTRKVALVLTSAVALTAIPHAAMAQTSASPYTTGYRYDAGARLVGTIRPGAGGSAGFLALRNTYDSQGNLSKVETGQLAAWQDETKLSSTWSGFTIFQIKDILRSAK